MRRLFDGIGRTNTYFLALCMIAVVVPLCGNLYKNLRYSTFVLTVKNAYPLSESSSGFIPARVSITPTQRTNTETIYGNLHTYWWANHTPIYTLGDPRSGLWFRTHSTWRGDFVLIPGDYGSRAAVLNVNVEDLNGNAVDDLIPGQWYQVEQYGTSFKIKLDW